MRLDFLDRLLCQRRVRCFGCPGIYRRRLLMVKISKMMQSIATVIPPPIIHHFLISSGEMSIDRETDCLFTCIVKVSFLFVKNGSELNMTLISACPKGGISGDCISCSLGLRSFDNNFII